MYMLYVSNRYYLFPLIFRNLGAVQIHLCTSLFQPNLAMFLLSNRSHKVMACIFEMAPIRAIVS